MNQIHTKMVRITAYLSDNMPLSKFTDQIKSDIRNGLNTNQTNINSIDYSFEMNPIEPLNWHNKPDYEGFKEPDQ